MTKEISDKKFVSFVTMALQKVKHFTGPFLREDSGYCFNRQHTGKSLKRSGHVYNHYCCRIDRCTAFIVVDKWLNVVERSGNHNHEPPECGNDIAQGHLRCPRGECHFCDITNFDKSKPLLPERNFVTCDSVNLIYKLTCLACREMYVGKTKKTLRLRVEAHITNLDAMEVNSHACRIHAEHCPGFSEVGFELEILEAVGPENPPVESAENLEKRLKEAEIGWIHRLGPTMNTMVPILGAMDSEPTEEERVSQMRRAIESAIAVRHGSVASMRAAVMRALYPPEVAALLAGVANSHQTSGGHDGAR